MTSLVTKTSLSPTLTDSAAAEGVVGEVAVYTHLGVAVGAAVGLIGG